MYSQRFTCMQRIEPMRNLELDSAYNILWEKCGHYSCYDPLPLGMNKAEHRYLGVTFKEMSVPFDEDTVVRGTWQFKDNWFHTTAEVYNPEKPWMRCPLWDMFKKAWEEQVAVELDDTPSGEGGPSRGARGRHGLDREQ